MSKTIINLDKWGLISYKESICAFGIVDEHPKLGKNIPILHTSNIINVEEKEDTYYFETINSIYVCKLEDISDEVAYNMNIAIGATKVAKVYNKYYKYKIYTLAKESNKPISKYKITLTEDEKKEFERILKLVELSNRKREEKEKLEDDKSIEEALKYSNCIFINLSSISIGSRGAFNINGRVGIIKPYVHTGMFTDTVIYENFEKNTDKISFRYYVRHFGLEPYNWTENIERIIVHNNKATPIYFNDTMIKPDETVEILRKDIYE